MTKFDISILFVDDEITLHQVYKKIIGKRVQSLIHAINGMQGLEMYQQFRPDLVITDIKMPVMNGLDMSLKIRKLNPNARIIILSAYSESQYYLRSIECGVKVFLLKPIEYEKLFQAISDQAEEILREKNLQYEENRRIVAEQSLHYNEKVLHAVSEAAKHLLEFGFNARAVNFILSKLGQAANASRVYFFENFKKNRLLFCKQTFEWTAEGIKAQIHNPDLQEVPFHTPDYKRWVEVLSQRKSIFGNVEDFPEIERPLLESQDIVSIIVVPIFVQNKWYGFLGFDDCLEKRNWGSADINSLMTASHIIGSAIYRTKIEKQLKSLNAELESRVIKRTLNLELEISERKWAEKLLSQSEEKYKSIFDNANDGIFLTTNDKIKFINPKFYELTGYFPKQMIGKSFIDFVHNDFKHIIQQVNLATQINEAGIMPIDIQIVNSSGKTKWVELKQSKIDWEEETGILNFLTDIDVRKKAENELHELNANLEDRVNNEIKQREAQQQFLVHKSKLESLGELAAGMAHEINQPLGGLSMSLENILDEIMQGTMSKNYVHDKVNLMFNDIERIKKIIDHIRLFSRNQDIVHNEPVSLKEIIDNTLLVIERMYINQLINLKINNIGLECKVLCNPFQLEQVLMNMFTNAKYAVEKKHEHLGENFIKNISLTAYCNHNHALIEITDNGIGIPQGIIQNIFDPFFTTKKNEEGTGLGLSISYGIIRNMGGKIEVDSKEGEYTKMTIVLPKS